MPSPFPGMDPYLEARDLWPDVHHSLITAIRDALAPQVAPEYYVRIERRTYSIQLAPEERTRVSRPDAAIIIASPSTARSTGAAVATAVAAAAQPVTLPRYEEVHEGYLEIRAARTRQVITAIEVLSPTNKMSSEGREEYEAKRRRVLQGMTSLVEIDLLRDGVPMEMEPVPASHYRIIVSRGWERPDAWLFGFSVRDTIPEVPVPLRQGEAEARLALGALLSDVYDRARYDIDLEYREEPPPPPLTPEDAAWMDELLRAKGLRGSAQETAGE